MNGLASRTYALTQIPRLSLEEAEALQTMLSRKVMLEDCLPDPIRTVAGVDVAYSDRHSFGAVAAFDYASMRPIETRTARRATWFPYIRSFLSFRELPPTLAAIRKLCAKPDIYLVDGHGRAHPRRLGFASHLGVVLDVPTIGVAKGLLCGGIGTGATHRWSPIVHEGEIVGAALYTRENAKPIYVSIGHKVSLAMAVGIVLHCTRRYRVPEPLREAHMVAQRYRKSQGAKEYLEKP